MSLMPRPHTLPIEPSLPVLDYAAISKTIEGLAWSENAKQQRQELYQIMQQLRPFFKVGGSGWQQAQWEEQMQNVAGALHLPGNLPVEGKNFVPELPWHLMPQVPFRKIRATTRQDFALISNIGLAHKIVFELAKQHKAGILTDLASRYELATGIKNIFASATHIMDVDNSRYLDLDNFKKMNTEQARDFCVQTLTQDNAFVDFLGEHAHILAAHSHRLASINTAFPSQAVVARDCYVLLEWAQRSGLLGDAPPEPTVPRLAARPADILKL